jgi:hypothetical protein
MDSGWKPFRKRNSRRISWYSTRELLLSWWQRPELSQLLYLSVTNRLSAGRNEALRDERQHQLQVLRDELESARALQKDERDSARVAEQERQEKIEEEAREERDRSLVPRTQLDIVCRFFGPQHGKSS